MAKHTINPLVAVSTSFGIPLPTVNMWEYQEQGKITKRWFEIYDNKIIVKKLTFTMDMLWPVQQRHKDTLNSVKIPDIASYKTIF